MTQAQFEAKLLSQQYLTPEQLDRAKQIQIRDSCSLARALWSLNLMQPQQFAAIAAAMSGDLTLDQWRSQPGHSLDPELGWTFTANDLFPIRFFPCTWADENTLVIAVEEPCQPVVAQTIQSVWPQAQLQEVLATESQILNLLIETQLVAEILGSGKLKLSQWQEAQQISQQTGSSFGTVLTRLTYLDPLEYLNLLSGLLGIPVISSLRGTGFLAFEPTVFRAFNPEMMMQHLFFPIAVSGREQIVILVQDPLDESIEATIYASFPGIQIEKFLGSEEDVTRLIDQFYGKKISYAAVYQLLSRSPSESASRVFTPTQIGLGYGLILFFLINLATNAAATFVFCMAVVNIFYLVAIAFKLLLSLAGSAGEYHEISDGEVAQLDEKLLPIYTILVPVYNEPEVVPILMQSLNQLDYPHEKLDVLLLLEVGDTVTIEAAKAAQPPRFLRFIFVPESHPKTKPKACNYGLAYARGDYLTIYDAEDIPEPDQLKKAVIAFRNSSEDLICVQAALNYFNRNENFLTRMFTLEYSYWFDYLLPGMDVLRLPIPLGGTSNHFRTDYLRELGGWDPFNVTEDADLGIRANQRGYKVGVINSTTFEEANCRPKNWIRQRSRWIKGYMQTWLVHNRHIGKSLKRLGLKSWLAYQLFIGGTPLTFLFGPILWFFFIYWFVTRSDWISDLFPGWLIYISLFNLFICNAIGIYLNMIAVFRRRYYELTLFALLNPFYWQMHSIAAYMALWQLFTKPFYWEKTIHGISKAAKVTTSH